MKNKAFRISVYISVLLIAASILLIITSWVIAAVNPNTHIRSLIGGEGIRWVFGSFVSNISSPLLVWLLLGGMSRELCVYSGLIKNFRTAQDAPSDYNRMAFHIVILLTILMIAVLALLAFFPHSFLLSAMGTLRNSSVASFVVPYMAFMVAIDSIVYGVIIGTYHSIVYVFKVACSGIASIAHYIIVYMCAIEFVCMLLWVING